MIVGVATGLAVGTIVPWAASARKVWPGRIVLLTDNPQGYASLEAAYGVELVPAVLRRDGAGVCDISRTRWECLAELLEGVDNPVCFVDTRDAVFQEDPVARVGEKLLIGSEGKPHRVNDWALGWVNELAPEWTDRMAGLPILCAGVIGGPAPLLREFALALYQRMPKIGCHCTYGATHMGDQALVNIFWRDGFKERAEITTDWVFHVLSLHDGGPWLDGDLVDGKLYRLDGALFPVVHQWDRLPQLAPFGDIR